MSANFNAKTIPDLVREWRMYAAEAARMAETPNKAKASARDYNRGVAATWRNAADLLESTPIATRENGK